VGGTTTASPSATIASPSTPIAASSAAAVVIDTALG